jgi:FtsP/CotA-like multicopper oxidase with cupredoxin domain
MRHGLPSLRLGLVSALVLLSSTCARFLPRQDATADVTTVQATSAFSLALEPTTLIAPTATYSTNVTTTATPTMATGAPEGSTLPTKYYKFEFTKGWVDANGNPREAILINGQTPGPLIEVEEGQQLTVRINPSSHMRCLTLYLLKD